MTSPHACVWGVFDDLIGRTARHQRPYVVVAPESRGQLRVWKREAVPVAPFPCMLCEAGFATHWLWEQHVETHHVSVQWYRQRLHYLVGRFDAVRPVGPQQWRFIVESYSEDFVSGSSSRPLCDEDEDWEGGVSLTHLTAEQYHLCAYQLAKAWSLRPWSPEGRSHAALHAFVKETLEPVLRPSEPCPVIGV